MQSDFTTAVSEAKPTFDFVAAHFACEQNRFSDSNPTGFVNLGSAQNSLHEERLRRRLADIKFLPEDSKYQPFDGTAASRASIADYLSSQLADSYSGTAKSASDFSTPAISPDNVVVGNGIISLLEALTVALLNEGDSVLIPTPVFPGLINAMSLRVKSRVESMPTSASDGFRLSPEDVEAELHRLQFQGKRVRAVLICSPGNPVGQVFSQAELQEFSDICECFDCALIVDEVFAGSTFVGNDFVSANVLQSDHVHVLGGLSKDFGLAGHATGWLHSTNTNVRSAVAKQSHFFRLPSPIHRVIASVLQPTWREAYLNHHQVELTETANRSRRVLEAAGIPVIESDAGLCQWLDLRSFLPSAGFQGEFELYETLLNEHRVHVSPGSGFKAKTPGYFRICFAQSKSILNEGLHRLVRGLHSVRRGPVESKIFSIPSSMTGKSLGIQAVE